jgi:hypothetical protein
MELPMNRKRFLLIAPLLAASCSLIATWGTPAVATTATSDTPPNPFFGPTSCSSGAVASGSYVRLTIAGNCSISAGKVVVLTDLAIQDGASLDAITPQQLVVKGNATVGRGAVFGFGCGPASTPKCSTPPDDRIRGTLTAVNPLAVIVHSSRIFGAVLITGGGGGVNCTPIPLLGAMSPAFTAFEDSQLNGGLSVDSMRSCWFGVIRNMAGNNVSVTNNTFADHDANEIVNNFILGNLACFNNSPHAQIGDSMGGPNTVTGFKQGECAGL